MILFPYLDSTQVILTDVGRRQASIVAVQGGGGGGEGVMATRATHSPSGQTISHISYSHHTLILLNQYRHQIQQRVSLFNEI